ncbi:hypothetical protein GS4_14_00270 [Gordonia soli NBRC 108243]|uniref:Uncharacterized protein n=2 Tax=Gordonia soli TaxID=320799 RepID=M0QI22_9ACTN|nr:hypothetical protein GS4_14_00270 [Gordonia soli NBRC 108243]
MLDGMPWDLTRAVNGPLTGDRISPDRAARRITAYIYGTILVLAALIPVMTSPETFGVAIIVGAAFSTSLAHTFAESVGQSLRAAAP